MNFKVWLESITADIFIQCFNNGGNKELAVQYLKSHFDKDPELNQALWGLAQNRNLNRAAIEVRPVFDKAKVVKNTSFFGSASGDLLAPNEEYRKFAGLENDMQTIKIAEHLKSKRDKLVFFGNSRPAELLFGTVCDGKIYLLTLLTSDRYDDYVNKVLKNRTIYQTQSALVKAEYTDVNAIGTGLMRQVWIYKLALLLGAKYNDFYTANDLMSYRRSSANV